MSFNIALVQMDVISGDPERNLSKAELFIRQATENGASLVCFPEMWTTGFNWQVNNELLSDSPLIIEKIAKLAKKYTAWLSGSVLVENADGLAVNRMLLINHTGMIVAEYDKIHLFSLIDEQRHLSAGNKLSIFDSPWGRCGLAICYDLRFPELFRSYALKGVDYILLCAAFPSSRREHWRILLRARAIENQCFMVAVNQAGQEKLATGDLTYCGNSAVIDSRGETIAETVVDREQLLISEIDIKAVAETRAEIPVFRDRRSDVYHL